MEKIDFYDEDQHKSIPLYVLAQTELADEQYILVTESDESEDEAECYIMRRILENDDDVMYEFVEDDTKLKALGKIFEELLDDVEIG